MGEASLLASWWVHSRSIGRRFAGDLESAQLRHWLYLYGVTPVVSSPRGTSSDTPLAFGLREGGSPRFQSEP
jgi:serine protease inhibitor ecotin